MVRKIFIIIILLAFTFAYNVGETITEGHQNSEFEICYGSDLDPNNDGVFQFAEYNGDLNGGDYYVIFLEMMATW